MGTEEQSRRIAGHGLEFDRIATRFSPATRTPAVAAPRRPCDAVGHREPSEAGPSRRWEAARPDDDREEIWLCPACHARALEDLRRLALPRF